MLQGCRRWIHEYPLPAAHCQDPSQVPGYPSGGLAGRCKIVRTPPYLDPCQPRFERGIDTYQGKPRENSAEGCDFSVSPDAINEDERRSLAKYFRYTETGDGIHPPFRPEPVRRCSEICIRRVHPNAFHGTPDHVAHNYYRNTHRCCDL